MGRLIKRKRFGKNWKVEIFYFRDGYRIYASRKIGNHWYESGATAYPQSLESAKKNLLDYKNVKDIRMLHPALR